MGPQAGPGIVRTATVKKFLQVVWFFAPLLAIMAVMMAALFALIQMRLGHWWPR
jgi:hypothetical protein